MIILPNARYWYRRAGRSFARAQDPSAEIDALVAEWKHDHSDAAPELRPPMPDTVSAFLRLVEAGWDAEATRRPHGQRTTVVVHVDVEKRCGALHLGPPLTDAERQDTQAAADLIRARVDLSLAKAALDRSTGVGAPATGEGVALSN